MFCGKCGSELYPGAKFCGVCGAPAPGADGGVGGEAPETDVAAASDDVSLATGGAGERGADGSSQGAVGSQAGRARRRSRRRMPMALIVAIAILAIATAAAAAYLVYTQVVNPNPPVAERVVDDGEAESGDDEAADAGEDAESDEDGDAETDAADDPAPAEKAPAKEQPAAHTYDCEYFTFTVTDPSVTDLVLVSQGHDAVEPVDEWYFDLVKADGSTDRLSIKIGDDLSGWAGETPPGGGITSDGRECKLTEGADGGGIYVDDGRATLTLK